MPANVIHDIEGLALCLEGKP